MECHVLTCHEIKPALDPKHIWRPKRPCQLMAKLLLPILLCLIYSVYEGLVAASFPARILAHVRARMCFPIHTVVEEWSWLLCFSWSAVIHFLQWTKLYLTALYVPWQRTTVSRAVIAFNENICLHSMYSPFRCHHITFWRSFFHSTPTPSPNPFTTALNHRSTVQCLCMITFRYDITSFSTQVHFEMDSTW